jgi:hypothetical protein
MAAPSFAFNTASALLNEASDLVEDARRIDRLADQVTDRTTRQELKEQVRVLLSRSSRISGLASSLPSESESAFKQKY